MRRHWSRWIWVAGILTCSAGLILAPATRPVQAAAKMLSKGETFVVESLPDSVTDTELTVLEAKGTVLTVQGKIPTYQGKPCVFCAKNLAIKPSLSVPFSRQEKFRSGSKGAKLQRMKVKQGGKEANGFMVMEGEGYFLTK